MSTTVGIDFGTHQTKVCVESGEDVRSMQYRFFPFPNLKGQDCLILPSVIQVNEDDTLSYGFFNERRAKKIEVEGTMEEPIEPDITKPVLSLPPQPVRHQHPASLEEAKGSKKQTTWRKRIELYKVLMGTEFTAPRKTYNDICNDIDARNEEEYAEWEQTCKIIQDNYNQQLAEYLAIKNKFDREYNTWLEQRFGVRNLIYRYFKQATFADYKWQEDINPLYLSIWFISNILFDLEEYYPEGFTIQMGVPTGKANLDKQQRKATQIVLSAYNLVENVFHNDKAAFLQTTREQLLKLTTLVPEGIYHKDLKRLKDQYSILVLPEAYAGLMSVTSRGRLAHGMNLMVDYGGGTTDISFFITAPNQYGVIEPLIHRYDSIPKGINYIVESSFSGPITELRKKNLSISSQLLDRNAKQSAILQLQSELKKISNKIVLSIYNNYNNTGLQKDRLNAALLNRPIIFAGGGATFQEMRLALKPFENIQLLGHQHWKGMYIEHIEQIVEAGLCPILTVALGLAVSKVDDQINICSMDDLFAHLIDPDRNVSKTSYIDDRVHDLDD